MIQVESSKYYLEQCLLIKWTYFKAVWCWWSKNWGLLDEKKRLFIWRSLWKDNGATFYSFDFSSFWAIIKVYRYLYTWSRAVFFQKKYCISFNESPLKMMKNVFYFIVKPYFIDKIFNFLSWFFLSSRKNSLIRKIKLISKFMTSQPG